jgi:hypothetical protein
VGEHVYPPLGYLPIGGSLVLGDENRAMSLYRGIQNASSLPKTNEKGDTRMIGGAMAAAVEAILVDDTEDERVIRWRIEQLASAGYSWACAMVIAANRDIDLHRAVGLVQHGCPVDTAVRILL